ncbi:hypothetical protein [Halovenus salina]|uniref:Uncharacterized protein n=1 Tax=Halovenus salina TaxID=1510225 RepID=A0ABD5W131_9EURY|nr:hypothetical protein [Halovenus salina]
MTPEWKKFEREIKHTVRDDSGLTYNAQRKVIGESGTRWRVDGVLFENEDPVSYLEVKYIGSNSDAETQYKLAFAQMADFRYADIPGAVVVPQKYHPGNKNWDEYFATIGCVLIGKEHLHDFIDSLQTFPNDISSRELIEEYVSTSVWDNLGEEQLKLAEEQEQTPPDGLQNIVDKHFDSND